VPTDVAFAIVEADKLFIPGQTVVVVDQGNALNSFTGPLKLFDPVAKTMTVNAQFASGAGAHGAWNIGLSAPVDNTLTGRVAALEVANAKLRSDALFNAKEFL
jgi:hypothetical protein